MGRRVYERAARPGTLLLIDHAGHNDLIERGGDAYWHWLQQDVAS